VKRKYEPGAFVPCSPKHKHCSPAHAQLVRGYREERERQYLQMESDTNGYEGEKELWQDNGGTLINFKTWLTSNAHRKSRENKLQSITKITPKKRESEERQQDYPFAIVRTASENTDSLSRIQRTGRLSIQKEKRNVS
jgi:hypothetical protein